MRRRSLVRIVELGLGNWGIGNQGSPTPLREADEQANRLNRSPSSLSSLHITYTQALAISIGPNCFFFKPITYDSCAAKIRWGQTEIWAGVRLKFYMGCFNINWAALVSAAPNPYT